MPELYRGNFCFLRWNKYITTINNNIDYIETGHISTDHFRDLAKMIRHIKDLPGEPGGRCLPSVPIFAEGGGEMVTYNDLFTFVIMICAVIALLQKKK